jgi:thiol-disulfide isomerase/thioredoxin
MRERLRTAYRSRRLVRWAVDGAVLVALVLVVGAWQTRNHLAGACPDFALPRLDSGSTVTRASLGGKPTLLVFWAPWCGVCKAESQNVSWVQRLVGDRANVVSVANSFRSVAEVQQYVHDHGVDYPVLLASEGLSGQFAVEAFPTAYFLDADGHIRHSVVGYTTTAGMLWRLFVP